MHYIICVINQAPWVINFCTAKKVAINGQKTIILIDEYDVPLENSYFRGFYNEMADFVRSLFESALKTNTSLGFAVVTGFYILLHPWFFHKPLCKMAVLPISGTGISQGTAPYGL